MFVPEFPFAVQVLCATRIVAPQDELDEEGQEEPEHELTCRVHGPSLELVSELKQPFGINGQPQDVTLDAAVIVPIGVVFEPQVEGQHTIEIAVDDRGISVPFTIVESPPET